MVSNTYAGIDLEGYAPCNDNALERHLGPFYERREVDADGQQVYTLAAHVREQFAGASGRAHGGFILMILDQAMGLAAEQALGAPTFTISMHVDFIGPAPTNEIAFVKTKVVSRTSSFAFMSAVVESNGAKVASGGGAWRLQQVGSRSA